MNWFDVVDALMCALVVIVLFKSWKRYIYKPVVWYLDDSESDRMMFRMRMKPKGCYVEEFACPKDMIDEYIKATAFFRRPSCVVVDYMLGSGPSGEDVLTFLRKNGVKCKIVTGYEGPIKGVSAKDIIHKSPHDSYFQEVESWINHATGRA